MKNGLKNKILNKAFNIAKNHPHKDRLQSLHAAIIYRGGSILSIGINKPKRNRYVDLHAHHPDCNMHAEIDAILKIRKKINLKGAKIMVARAKKDDMLPGNSKPCIMCSSIIKNHGIKRVYYTISIEEFGSYLV